MRKQLSKKRVGYPKWVIYPCTCDEMVMMMMMMNILFCNRPKSSLLSASSLKQQRHSMSGPESGGWTTNFWSKPAVLRGTKFQNSQARRVNFVSKHTHDIPSIKCAITAKNSAFSYQESGIVCPQTTFQTGGRNNCISRSVPAHTLFQEWFTHWH